MNVFVIFLDLFNKDLLKDLKIMIIKHSLSLYFKKKIDFNFLEYPDVNKYNGEHLFFIYLYEGIYDKRILKILKIFNETKDSYKWRTINFYKLFDFDSFDTFLNNDVLDKILFIKYKEEEEKNFESEITIYFKDFIRLLNREYYSINENSQYKYEDFNKDEYDLLKIDNKTITGVLINSLCHNPFETKIFLSIAWFMAISEIKNKYVDEYKIYVLIQLVELIQNEEMGNMEIEFDILDKINNEKRIDNNTKKFLISNILKAFDLLAIQNEVDLDFEWQEILKRYQNMKIIKEDIKNIESLIIFEQNIKLDVPTIVSSQELSNIDILSRFISQPEKIEALELFSKKEKKFRKVKVKFYTWIGDQIKYAIIISKLFSKFEPIKFYFGSEIYSNYQNILIILIKDYQENIKQKSIGIEKSKELTMERMIYPIDKEVEQNTWDENFENFSKKFQNLSQPSIDEMDIEGDPEIQDEEIILQESIDERISRIEYPEIENIDKIINTFNRLETKNIYSSPLNNKIFFSINNKEYVLQNRKQISIYDVYSLIRLSQLQNDEEIRKIKFISVRLGIEMLGRFDFDESKDIKDNKAFKKYLEYYNIFTRITIQKMDIKDSQLEKYLFEEKFKKKLKEIQKEFKKHILANKVIKKITSLKTFIVINPGFEDNKKFEKELKNYNNSVKKIKENINKLDYNPWRFNIKKIFEEKYYRKKNFSKNFKKNLKKRLLQKKESVGFLRIIGFESESIKKYNMSIKEEDKMLKILRSNFKLIGKDDQEMEDDDDDDDDDNDDDDDDDDEEEEEDDDDEEGDFEMKDIEKKKEESEEEEGEESEEEEENIKESIIYFNKQFKPLLVNKLDIVTRGYINTLRNNIYKKIIPIVKKNRKEEEREIKKLLGYPKFDEHMNKYVRKSWEFAERDFFKGIGNKIISIINNEYNKTPQNSEEGELRLRFKLYYNIKKLNNIFTNNSLNKLILMINKRIEIIFKNFVRFFKKSGNEIEKIIRKEKLKLDMKKILSKKMKKFFKNFVNKKDKRIKYINSLKDIFEDQGFKNREIGPINKKRNIKNIKNFKQFRNNCYMNSILQMFTHSDFVDNMKTSDLPFNYIFDSLKNVKKLMENDNNRKIHALQFYKLIWGLKNHRNNIFPEEEFSYPTLLLDKILDKMDKKTKKKLRINKNLIRIGVSIHDKGILSVQKIINNFDKKYKITKSPDFVIIDVIRKILIRKSKKVVESQGSQFDPILIDENRKIFKKFGEIIGYEMLPIMLMEKVKVMENDYELYGIVMNRNDVHCYAYIKVDKKWYLRDIDSKIKAIKFDRIINNPGKSTIEREINVPNILFYRKSDKMDID